MEYFDGILQSDKIYRKFMDDESRIIYKARLNYLISKNENDYLIKIEQVGRLKTWIAKFLDMIHENNKKIILFGAGNDGTTFKQFLRRHSIEPYAYCDNSKNLWGKDIDNIPIISLTDLFDLHSNDIIVISTTKYADDIYQQLKNNKIPLKNIIKLEPCLQQYFDIFKPVDGEVFVDAGCFDASTANDFSKWCHGAYKSIYAFEPNRKALDTCRDNIRTYNLNNMHLINKGTWSKTDRLTFNNAGQGSQIGENGTDVVDVVSIDEVMEGKRVDFIKMDVEGSEIESLMGAKKTILKYKPRLAVCVYHKPEDILFIPMFLSQIVPEYHFYLRHYSFDMRETVLYAEC